MLPFDLTKALAAPDSVVYRNGEVPLEWHYFKDVSSDYKIYAIDKSGTPHSNKTDGKFGASQYHEHDLFLKEPEMFVNVNSNNAMDDEIYLSLTDARNNLGIDGKTYRLVEVTDK